MPCSLRPCLSIFVGVMIPLLHDSGSGLPPWRPIPCPLRGDGDHSTPSPAHHRRQRLPIPRALRYTFPHQSEHPTMDVHAGMLAWRWVRLRVQAGMHWKGGGLPPPPPPSRTPSLRPATASLTASASLNGICNRH